MMTMTMTMTMIMMMIMMMMITAMKKTDCPEYNNIEAVAST